MDLDVAELSEDELVIELATWAGPVAAGEAVVLRLLGELDARGTWAKWGALSCAHWEERWVDLARSTTTAQLEKAVRGVGRARQADRPRQERPEAVRIGWDTDGTLLLNLRISAARAPGVLAALESAQQAEQAERDGFYAELASALAQGPTGDDVSAETSTSASTQTSAGVSAETPGPPQADPDDYVEPPYPLALQRPDPFAPHSADELSALAAWRVERDLDQCVEPFTSYWRATGSTSATSST